MKKIMIVVLLFTILSGCEEKGHEKSVICRSTVSEDKANGETKFFYNEDLRIVAMEEKMTFILKKEDFKDYTYEQYYDEMNKLYAPLKEAKGVNVTLKKDKENNKINASLRIELDHYDFVEDVLNLGNGEDYNDVGAFINNVEAYGMSTCDEIK